MYEEIQVEKILKKLQRLEKMLYARMFLPVDRVEMKAFVTREAMHKIPDEALFKTCEKGRRWFGEGLYCWFLGAYTVPEERAGQALYLFPKIRGYEGLLWVDGKPYGNFTSKEIENSYGYHYCDLLTKGKAAGERVEIALEYYSHHYVRGTQPFEESDEVFEIIYNGADICVKDELICDFFYDLRIANQMAEFLPRDQFRRADVVRTLQLTPGVSVGTEGVSGLFVRGGNSDENLFLIDGNPVYQVNHLGGVFSAFNNEAIKSMHFYKAGFPARFGGRLSSVVDVQTKEGNMKEYHGSATLGLTSGNLNFEGPLWRDRTSFNIALRRTWLDVLSVPTLAIMNKRRKKNNAETFDFRYAFHDLNARIDHRFSDRSRMYVSLYNGNDVFHFTKKEYPTTESDNYDDCRKARMRWGNLVASAGWTYAFNNKLFGKLSGFYTRYHSKIAYAEESITGQQGDSDYRYIQDDTENRTGITDFGVRTAFDYQPVASHRIRFGADYLAHYFRPEYNRVGATDTDKPDSMQIARVFADDHLWAHEAALYAEDDWDISEAFRLNAGLRFSLFNVEGKTYTGWEPRLSLRYLVTPSLSLKASYSRMNQYVHQIRNSYLDLPTDSWLPVTRRLKPLTSDQFSVGAYYNWNRMLDFSVEGYYKRLDNLLEYKEGHSLVPSTVAWEDKMAVGDGRAYGVEFMVRKPAGRLTGWVGYALSWADRQFPELNYGRRFPSRYDNRHKLNIVAMYKLSERIELSAAWTYSSGNMVTISLENYLPGDDLHKPALPGGEDSFEYAGGGYGDLNYYAGRNNYRLPAYHRLDLGLKIYRPLKKGRMGIWSVGLYNAYCRMNPVLVRKEYEYGGRAFKTLGFLPVVPSVSYTYKF